MKLGTVTVPTGYMTRHQGSQMSRSQDRHPHQSWCRLKPSTFRAYSIIWLKVSTEKPTWNLKSLLLTVTFLTHSTPNCEIHKKQTGMHARNANTTKNLDMPWRAFHARNWQLLETKSDINCRFCWHQTTTHCGHCKWPFDLLALWFCRLLTACTVLSIGTWPSHVSITCSYSKQQQQQNTLAWYGNSNDSSQQQ